MELQGASCNVMNYSVSLHFSLVDRRSLIMHYVVLQVVYLRVEVGILSWHAMNLPVSVDVVHLIDVNLGLDELTERL